MGCRSKWTNVCFQTMLQLLHIFHNCEKSNKAVTICYIWYRGQENSSKSLTCLEKKKKQKEFYFSKRSPCSVEICLAVMILMTKARNKQLDKYVQFLISQILMFVIILNLMVSGIKTHAINVPKRYVQLKNFLRASQSNNATFCVPLSLWASAIFESQLFYYLADSL